MTLWASLVGARGGISTTLFPTSKVGVHILLEDAADSADLVRAAVERLKLLRPHVLFAPYSSGLTPPAAEAALPTPPSPDTKS